MIHLYYGDGKGKTTAAMGLVLRWVGGGGRAVVAQFLKSAGSGERLAMEQLPHEIGFFLGYPYEDVEGFVRHRGRKFRFCGCWKVYGDPRAAAKLFARYRRCTRRCVRLRRSGSKVVDIAAGCRYRGRGGA